MSVAALICTLGGCQQQPSAAAPTFTGAQDRDTDTDTQQPSPKAESNIFLSVLPVVASDGARKLVETSPSHLAFSQGLRVRLELVKSHKTAGELSRRTQLPPVNGVFLLSDLSRLSASDSPTSSQLDNTFILDHAEAALTQPADEFKARHRVASADNVETFVSDYITHKNYTRSFDIASRVALSRAGDCTEHAVLAAALLRRFGVAARLVFGIVLVGTHSPGEEGHVEAASHAWVEAFDRGAWQIVDAALHTPTRHGGENHESIGVPGLSQGSQLRLAYLPLTVLKDEGPGYTRALMEDISALSVLHIRVDSVAP